MSASRTEAPDGAPLPTFKGSLNRYVYKSPSSSPTKNTKDAAVASPKRKLDEITEGRESVAAQSSSSDSLLARPRPVTRSKSSPTTLISSQSSRTTSTTSRGSRRGRSSNNSNGSSRSTSSSGAAASGSPNTTGISHLRDTIPPNLILLLIGVNPGILTGQTGYVYAHPSNLYWKLLNWSGITTHRHPPSDTYRLPPLYCVGNTNIVSRATKDASQLSRQEMDDGVPVLERKIAENRPEAVCLVGKSIWEAVWRVKTGRKIKKEEFKYGWQDERYNMGKIAASGDDDASEGWNGARVFVATTTSGLAAGMSLAEKQAVWNELGGWVKTRRQEMGFPEPSLSEALSAENS